MAQMGLDWGGIGAGIRPPPRGRGGFVAQGTLLHGAALVVDGADGVAEGT